MLSQLTSPFQLLPLIQPVSSIAQTDQKEILSETVPPKLSHSQKLVPTVFQTCTLVLPVSHGHMPFPKDLLHGQQTLLLQTSQFQQQLPIQPVITNTAQTDQKEIPSETVPPRPFHSQLRDGTVFQTCIQVLPVPHGLMLFPKEMLHGPQTLNQLTSQSQLPTPPAGLEHCPDLPERQTLRDGVTKPIVFPAKGANCTPDIYPGKEGAPAPYH